MTPPTNGDRIRLSLSREGAWVAHAALLDAGAAAGRGPRRLTALVF